MPAREAIPIEVECNRTLDDQTQREADRSKENLPSDDRKTANTVTQKFLPFGRCKFRYPVVLAA